jgi:hypothetical protein
LSGNQGFEEFFSIMKVKFVLNVFQLFLVGAAL